MFFLWEKKQEGLLYLFLEINGCEMLQQAELLLGKGVLFTFGACQLGGEFGCGRSHTFCIASRTHSLAGASGSSLQSQSGLLDRKNCYFSCGQCGLLSSRGTTVCSLRLDSLVFAAEPNGSAREKALPSGVWMRLSVKAKRDSTSWSSSERPFSALGHSHSECGCSLTGDCLPLQLEQNQIFGRLGVEMSWEKRK